MTKRIIVLKKEAQRSLGDDKIDAQTGKIKKRCLDSGRFKRGWRCKSTVTCEEPSTPGMTYLYTATFTFTCNPLRQRKPESIEREWEHIQKVAQSAGNTPKWFPPDVIKQVTDQVITPVVSGIIQAKSSLKEYAELTIPANWMEWFEHVYDREDQLIQVMSVIEEAIESNFSNRFNIILWGPPGSGKTEICRSLRKQLPTDAWMEFDATNTTAAGAIKALTGNKKTPRILFLEEIEKADKADKKWLLSASDLRAEIRKVNFRESVNSETKFLCIMTVNDIMALRSEMGTALQSRFPYQIECPHPNEETMRKILERQIRRRPAFDPSHLAWIDPVIKFAAEKETQVTDPRRLEAWCLAGKNQPGYLDRVRRTQFSKKEQSLRGVS